MPSLLAMRAWVALLAAWGTCAFGYQLERDSKGNTARWNQPVTFVIDERLAQQLGEPATNDAIAAAAQSLSNSVDGIHVETDVGPVPDLGPDPDALDGRNEVRVLSPWPFDSTMLARTHVEFDTHRHVIIEADVLLNGDRLFRALPPSGDSSLGAFDVQSILTHEIGHALGLAHNPDDAMAVMFPSVAPGETSKRQLSSDDVSGLRALYDQRPGCSTSGSGPAVWLSCLALAAAFKLRRSRSSQ